MVGGSDFAVVLAGAEISFGVAVAFDPADTVEAFLEDIVGARDEVVIFPEAEAIGMVGGGSFF